MCEQPLAEAVLRPTVALSSCAAECCSIWHARSQLTRGLTPGQDSPYTPRRQLGAGACEAEPGSPQVARICHTRRQLTQQNALCTGSHGQHQQGLLQPVEPRYWAKRGEHELDWLCSCSRPDLVYCVLRSSTVQPNCFLCVSGAGKSALMGVRIRKGCPALCRLSIVGQPQVMCKRTSRRPAGELAGCQLAAYVCLPIPKDIGLQMQRSTAIGAGYRDHRLWSECSCHGCR